MKSTEDSKGRESPAGSPSTKVVPISTSEPETITLDTSLPPSRRSSISLCKTLSVHRLHGRALASPHLAACVVTRDVTSRVALPDHKGNDNTPPGVTEHPEAENRAEHGRQDGERSGHDHVNHRLAGQIHTWIADQREKRAQRRQRRSDRKGLAAVDINAPPTPTHDHLSVRQASPAKSDSSNDESLETLEAILAAAIAPQSHRMEQRPTRSRKPSGHYRRSLVAATSDTEYASDGEAVVPACEEWLKMPEEIGMDRFKKEVLKLAHTLRCRGWRRVELSRSGEVGVERISGALTNAVYMISPPANVPASGTTVSSTTSLIATKNLSTATFTAPLTPTPGTPIAKTKSPPRLLLRIYGPQVSHLIDRDTELSILRRLARNNIGPRLLGTFMNGRFEQFFTAVTLTRRDIRVPETSRHIAKRLKELHEGIELLDTEHAHGPVVWLNWRKWAPRCENVLSNLSSSHQPLGCSWADFSTVVGKYKFWLEQRYKSQGGVPLVFAHNDTQYGNILRLRPPPGSGSPLLLPSNSHRQLVVIDFEYASANPVGFEVANHFCEWTADYHDAARPHKVHFERYPNEKERKNFVQAYVEHSLAARYGNGNGSSSIGAGTPGGSSFDLDASDAGEKAAEERRKREREVEHVLDEARVWRAAAHAMWTMWGVVQAKVGGDEEEEAEEPEFDYLKYAHERATGFWNDVVQLGVVEKTELREGVRVMVTSEN